jgi:hypothetical protein
MSLYTCLWESRSPNSRTLAPSSYTMVHMTISHDHKLTPSGLRGCDASMQSPDDFPIGQIPTPFSLTAGLHYAWSFLDLMVQIYFNGWIQRLRCRIPIPDTPMKDIAKSHFAISEFLMHCVLDISNPDPRNSDATCPLHWLCHVSLS